MTLRLAHPADLPALGDIERLAAERFSTTHLPAHLRGHTLPRDVLQRGLEAGLLWVVEHAGHAVGFLLAEREGQGLHIAEVSVHPDHGGQGHGRALLEAAAERARAEGLPCLTLTTFDDVPWNRPFYERAGFQVLAEAACDSALAAHLAAEREAGLSGRVAMRRVVG
ncbi:GNAT family N-acetyltransferase [Metapseudomonas otitidis]|uniref:GNAT family N-acetyltransferase n=1 Tax=Metapseudomonas otitidis TaxID=319939 RepID=UPI001CA412A0|nr:GNAT family N-acetyltransferase [Pseudomonas otitidis]QZX83856.1 GNAT family N-acetyltransferase [Pseudomonas otitidis]